MGGGCVIDLKLLLNPFEPEAKARILWWLSARTKAPVSVIAQAYRGTLGRNTCVIAVTGSFGKTTTTRAIAAVLGQPTDREFVTNAFCGLYAHLMRQTGRQPHAVLEVGIGQPGQMRRYASVLRPDVVVVTSINDEHTSYFPDGLDGIRNEKNELVRTLRPEAVAVLNRDDERVMWMVGQTRARVVTYGRRSEADVRLLDVAAHPTGARLTVRIAGSDHVIESRLFGLVSAGPMLAALAAAYAAGLDVRAAASALGTLTPTSRRLQIVRLPNGTAAILDDYKCTPPTAFAAFEAMDGLPRDRGRRFGVLGNIPLSTAEPKAPIYRALGESAGKVLDRALLIHLADEHFEHYRDGLIASGVDPANITRIDSVHEATAILRSELRSDDVLLLKGHFIDKLSRIVLMLQGVDVRCGMTLCKIRGSHWCDRCPGVFNGPAFVELGRA